jgi:hypothetical protein
VGTNLAAQLSAPARPWQSPIIDDGLPLGLRLNSQSA